MGLAYRCQRQLTGGVLIEAAGETGNVARPIRLSHDVVVFFFLFFCFYSCSLLYLDEKKKRTRLPTDRKRRGIAKMERGPVIGGR